MTYDEAYLLASDDIRHLWDMAMAGKPLTPSQWHSLSVYLQETGVGEEFHDRWLAMYSPMSLEALKQSHEEESPGILHDILSLNPLTSWIVEDTNPVQEISEAYGYAGHQVSLVTQKVIEAAKANKWWLIGGGVGLLAIILLMRRI